MTSRSGKFMMESLDKGVLIDNRKLLPIIFKYARIERTVQATPSLIPLNEVVITEYGELCRLEGEL